MIRFVKIKAKNVKKKTSRVFVSSEKGYEKC